MSKALSTTATNQYNRNDVKGSFDLFINDVKCNDVISYTRDFNRDFGCASLEVIINNDSGVYSTNGAHEIKKHDIVRLIEKIVGATDTFNNFHGKVVQRNISKSSAENNMTITCLDYIVELQNTDIEKDCEATKYLVENEILTPVYLDSPNEMFASIFNFDNTNLAQDPPVSIRVRNKESLLEDPQWGGWELNYESGQIILGFVINARDNFEIIATYYFYPKGLYAEDVLEEIIEQPDGYGNYLFGETSADGVLDNHLTETFTNVTGKSVDTLTRNKDFLSVDMESTLTVACTKGDTIITISDTTGYPNTGNDTSFIINGDTSTYKYITGSTIYGIPATGTNAIQTHPIGSYVTYTASFPPNQVWSLTFDNLITTLSSGADFTLPAGERIRYIDKRFGNVVLHSPIASNSVVQCNTNYSFKTLQATGIEINGIKFKEKNDQTRFDAINRLRQFVAPNYVIRTVGDDKIWASYLNQKDTADYTLKSIRNINYGEDTDVYTRTLFYGKNANPHNLMFDNGASFISTGNTYTGVAINTQLTYEGDEAPYRIFKTGLSAGTILQTESYPYPIVYINGSPVDNNVHEILQTAVVIKLRQETYYDAIKEKDWFGNVTIAGYRISYSYVYYIYFSHNGIIPTQPIIIYDENGVEIINLSANSGSVNYEQGIYISSGNQPNSTIERASTASYWISYSTDDLQIDYENVKFKIHSKYIPTPAEANVSATFEYRTVSIPIENAPFCFDGQWDTQTQTIFYAKPPSGYVYAILDFGEIKDVQLLDMIIGFFKPDGDGRRKFETTNYLTLQYSYDNGTYYSISPETTHFSITSGETKTFDEKDLGESFSLRYLKIIIEDMEKIEYTEYGVYALSFVEIRAYSDIVLRGECKLIPTTELLSDYNGESTMYVQNTTAFPSGAGLAYFNSGPGLSTSAFWYSGKTNTTFTGVTGSGIGSYIAATKVYQSIETSTSLYDPDYLLEDLGDIVYKNINVNEYLDTQDKVDLRAKNYLKEFYKNHTTNEVSAIYSPHYQIGDTLYLPDTYNRIEENYFIEKISGTQDSVSLTLARYQ